MTEQKLLGQSVNARAKNLIMHPRALLCISGIKHRIKPFQEIWQGAETLYTPSHFVGFQGSFIITKVSG